jgi:hypothetical protein
MESQACRSGPVARRIGGLGVPFAVRPKKELTICSNSECKAVCWHSRAAEPTILGVVGGRVLRKNAGSETESQITCRAGRDPSISVFSPQCDAARWNGFEIMSQVAQDHGCLPHLARQLVPGALQRAGHSPLAHAGQKGKQPQKYVEAAEEEIRNLAGQKLLTMSILANETLRSPASIGREYETDSTPFSLAAPEG